MTSNLDKLAEIVSAASGRTARNVSISFPITLLEEMDRMAEVLAVPRSVVVQGLVRDALVARHSRPFLQILKEHDLCEAQGVDPSTCGLGILADCFDPEKYDIEGLTLGDAYEMAKSEIDAAEKRWSL
jgi:hypothetical protein